MIWYDHSIPDHIITDGRWDVVFDSQEVAVHRALGGCFALAPRVLVASTGGNRESQMTDGGSFKKISR